ncbi:MAG: sel1 repeat family protein [Elusimicrobia bacterium]|nr:sel1 repeat family protein [Elusimicrobiota bacterium]
MRPPLRLLPAVLLVCLCARPEARADSLDDAFAALASNDLPRAKSLARPAAEKGDFLAQFVLGAVLRVTGAAPKEGDEAEKWLKQAAENASRAAQTGDPRAKYVLGRLNFDALLWEKDDAKALNWFRSAAEDGYAPAQSQMGFMYEWGDGLPRDLAAAATWYR